MTNPALARTQPDHKESQRFTEILRVIPALREWPWADASLRIPAAGSRWTSDGRQHGFVIPWSPLWLQQEDAR